MNNENIINLGALSLLFMFSNDLPLNVGLEELIAESVTRHLHDYYVAHDMAWNINEPFADDAIRYAFERLQEMTDMVKMTASMMIGGGMN